MQQPGVKFKEGVAEIRLWAPLAQGVELLLVSSKTKLPFEKGERGYWHLTTAELKPGDKYRFVLDGIKERPDPASLAQPDGVHGPSQAIDITSYSWQHDYWKPVPLEDYIIYELHTGTFSPEGTFEGIEQKLDYLAALGITAIEIMPVAAFPGARNWGYDGVAPYAVQSSYGGAEGLIKLVDAAHGKGLAVVLDVVYNHFGPEGNYLAEFGPYFTDKYRTPWGSAVNFDDAGSDAVRAFFIQNALMWLRDFRIDALRMDATHAIQDFGPKHLLQELREHTDLLMRESGRQHYLIIETEQNDPRFITPTELGGCGMDAQWLDDFHHALRRTAGEAARGYYSDYDGIEVLAKSYRDAFVYDGFYSRYRDRTYGAKARSNEGYQFIAFSQNHDQIGNRMLGERTSGLVSFEMLKLLAGAVMVSPFLPMLFMGEEWAESAPFLYFVSHSDEALIKAVCKGRKAEFAHFHAQGEAPDPQAEESFMRSKLNWHLPEKGHHATMLRYYKAIIALRRHEPALKPLREGTGADADIAQGILTLTRRSTETALYCYLNFSGEEGTILPSHDGENVFASSSPEWGGAHPMPVRIAAGELLKLPPESISIYRCDV